MSSHVSTDHPETAMRSIRLKVKPGSMRASNRCPSLRTWAQLPQAWAWPSFVPSHCLSLSNANLRHPAATAGDCCCCLVPSSAVRLCCGWGSALTLLQSGRHFTTHFCTSSQPPGTITNVVSWLPASSLQGELTCVWAHLGSVVVPQAEEGSWLFPV